MPNWLINVALVAIRSEAELNLCATTKAVAKCRVATAEVAKIPLIRAASLFPSSPVSAVSSVWSGRLT